MNHTSLNYEALTHSLPTKSEKIRTLGRAGVSTGDIARFLGIRYQFARNVLADAGLLGNSREAEKQELAEPAASFAHEAIAADGWLRTSPDGSLMVPAALLYQSGLKAGEAVLVRQAEDCLEILSQAAGLVRAQKLVRQYVPVGVSLVDELISDRRAAASAEDAA